MLFQVLLRVVDLIMATPMTGEIPLPSLVTLFVQFVLDACINVIIHLLVSGCISFSAITSISSPSLFFVDVA